MEATIISLPRYCYILGGSEDDDTDGRGCLNICCLQLENLRKSYDRIALTGERREG